MFYSESTFLSLALERCPRLSRHIYSDPLFRVIILNQNPALNKSVHHSSVVTLRCPNTTVGPRFTGILGVPVISGSNPVNSLYWGKFILPVYRGSGKTGPGKSGSDCSTNALLSIYCSAWLYSFTVQFYYL